MPGNQGTNAIRQDSGRRFCSNREKEYIWISKIE
jgi:hypothetical protein